MSGRPDYDIVPDEERHQTQPYVLKQSQSFERCDCGFVFPAGKESENLWFCRSCSQPRRSLCTEQYVSENPKFAAAMRLHLERDIRPRLLTKPQLEQFADKGYLVLPDFIPEKLVARANRSIYEQIGRPDAWKYDQFTAKFRLKGVLHQLKRTPPIQTLLHYAPLYAIISQLFGGAQNIMFTKGAQLALRPPDDLMSITGGRPMVSSGEQTVPSTAGEDCKDDQQHGSYTWLMNRSQNPRLNNPMRWHVDGLKEGWHTTFSLLVGVVLSHVDRPWMGNLCVLPRSHRFITPCLQAAWKAYCEHPDTLRRARKGKRPKPPDFVNVMFPHISTMLGEGTAVTEAPSRRACSNREGTSEGDDDNDKPETVKETSDIGKQEEKSTGEVKTDEPQGADEGNPGPITQMLCRPGDVTLLHQKLVHCVAPNLSGEIRNIVYFRVRNQQTFTGLDQKITVELDDIWAAYPGCKLVLDERSTAWARQVQKYWQLANSKRE